VQRLLRHRKATKNSFINLTGQEGKRDRTGASGGKRVKAWEEETKKGEKCSFERRGAVRKRRKKEKNYMEKKAKETGSIKRGHPHGGEKGGGLSLRRRRVSEKGTKKSEGQVQKTISYACS